MVQLGNLSRWLSSRYRVVDFIKIQQKKSRLKKKYFRKGNEDSASNLLLSIL